VHTTLQAKEQALHGLLAELGSVVDPVADVRNGLGHGGTRMST